MTVYTSLQIIKHALQYYIHRPNADEQDVLKEKRLLEKVIERIDIEIYRNNSCAMCTNSCNECQIKMFIEDLGEILGYEN